MPQQYPKDILPQENYRFINCDIDNRYLVRHVDVEDQSAVMTDNQGMVLAEYICSPKERIQDLSTNLLGTFRLSYTNIEFTKIGKEIFNEYCDPNYEGICPKHPEHFSLTNLRKYWGFNIGQFKEKFIDGVTINLNESATPCSCYIRHTPTKGNFWHFSVRWTVDGRDLFEDETIDTKELRKIATKIGAVSRAMLMQIAKTDIENAEPLQAACFSIS